MERKKTGLMGGLIYLVIFVAYNLLVFLVFNDFNTVFWISYGFMAAAFLIHIMCTFSVAKNRSVKAVFFGIPLISFSVYFVCAEFFCSLVFMIFKNMASIKVTVLIQALLLCAFVAVAVVSIMSRDIVQNMDNKIKENVSFIKGILVDVEMMMHKSADAAVTGALKKLSEIIKYSDPMANSAVASQEQMIMQYMVELRSVFDAGNTAGTIEICQKLELLFVERNKKLMISK